MQPFIMKLGIAALLLLFATLISARSEEGTPSPQAKQKTAQTNPNPGSYASCSRISIARSRNLCS